MVSVCIPVYNGARYIGATLQSLAGQTFTDMEVIVSDNASTDGTRQVVENFMGKIPNLHYTRNERNLGYTANISAAFRASEAEIVAFYHADDLYAPGIIEREVHILHEHPSVSAVFSRASRFSDGTGFLDEPRFPAGFGDIVPYESEIGAYCGGLQEIGEAVLRYGNFFVCPSFMTRRDAYVESGGFSSKYPTSEDLHLWIQYLRSGKRLALLDEPLVQYRISPNQGSASLSSHTELSISFQVIDDLLIPGNAFSKVTVDRYCSRKASNLLQAARNCYITRKPAEAVRRVIESRQVHRYSGLSRNAFLQRWPRIALPLWRAASQAKRAVLGILGVKGLTPSLAKRRVR